MGIYHYCIFQFECCCISPEERRDCSIFLNPLSRPVIPVEHQVMDKSREENFPLQKAVPTTIPFLLLLLKHLQMLWSEAAYCIKITICLIRYSSSAVPRILLQSVTSSSCLGGSSEESLCKHKLCTRGSSLFKKVLLRRSSP